MNSSSVSVLPDVSTNQSPRAASLPVHTHVARVKWVFVSGEIITGKNQRGALSKPKKSSIASQALDRHLITI